MSKCPLVEVTTMVVCWLLVWAAAKSTMTAWPVCSGVPGCLMTGNRGQENEYRYTVEGKKMIIKTFGDSFEIGCGDKLNIESSSLPRYLRTKAFNKVTVKKCPVPQKNLTSYDELLLTAFNVTVFKELVIDSPVTTHSLSSLGHQHFARLNIEKLKIHNVPLSIYLNVTYDCFKHIQGLKELVLKNINLPETTSMELTNNLQSLYIRDSWPLPVMLKSVKSLKILETRENGDKQKIRAIVECDKIETIDVTAPFTKSLPQRWLVRCNNLNKLYLYKLSLKTFPPRIVSEKNSLKKLKASSCGLKELFEDSFENMVELRFLDLSNNLIENLPSKVFEPLIHLEELNLSRNHLSILGDLFSSLTKLKCLSLANNPLGDICGAVGDTAGLSVLANISSLEYLNIKSPDWRSNLRYLNKLDLTHNNISRLEYDDLLFFGNEKMHVNISGNPMKEFIFSKQDYDHALQLTLNERHKKVERMYPVNLFLGAKIECDCYAYWFARIQCAPDPDSIPWRVARVHGMQCLDGRALCEVDFDTMTCAMDGCTPYCSCQYRASDNATIANCSWSATAGNNSIELPPGDPLVVHAERSGLINLPNAPNATELHLQWNLIRTINSENIYDKLRVLDLRNNDIQRIDLVSLNAIFLNSNRKVLLSANPLKCDCEDRSSLSALKTFSVQIADYEELRCANARSVRDIHKNTLCDTRDSEVLLSVLVASLAFISITIVLVKINYNRIVDISNLLFNSNYQRSDRKRSEKQYDIFISFSYRNINFVKWKLLPWLEEPPRCYRVCVNYRDWEAPELIHTLIISSVRDSSCTIVVLSEHYLNSKWTRRTEFRTAQAAAMLDDSKLLVIMLRPAAELNGYLDPEIRTYLEANTYLLWGDRWFWKKLQAALPPPTTFSIVTKKSSDRSPQRTATIVSSSPLVPYSATDLSTSAKTSRLYTASAPLLLSIPSLLQSKDYAKSGYSTISFLPSTKDKLASSFILRRGCPHTYKEMPPLFNLSSSTPTISAGV